MCYITEVAAMFGVEIEEKFDVIMSDGSISILSPYFFNGKELVDKNGDTANLILIKLILGDATIKKKQWIPKQNGEYYYVNLDGYVDFEQFDKDDIFCLYCLKSGNCYKTRLAAKSDEEKWTNFFEGNKKLIIGEE